MIDDRSLTHWQGVLFMKCCSFFSSNIPLLIVSKEFYFNFLSPKHLFPEHIKLNVLLHTYDVGFYDEDTGKVFKHRCTVERCTTTPESAFFNQNGDFDLRFWSAYEQFSQRAFMIFNPDFYSPHKMPSLNYISHFGNCNLTTFCYIVVALLCIVGINNF